MYRDLSMSRLDHMSFPLALLVICLARRLLNNRESAKRVRDKREDDSIGYSEKVG
jgi:hypothetical protein